MPYSRKVWRKGDRLPGRIEEGCLACSTCWTAKDRDMFLSRPLRGKDGEWRSKTLAVCSTCRRKASAEYKALRAARARERSEARGASAHPR